MIGIIIVFSKQTTAVMIRNILLQNGFNVAGACTSGGHAVQIADTMEEGIIICGYEISDMTYHELREYVPASFRFLLIASESLWEGDIEEGVQGIGLPVSGNDLISALNAILSKMKADKLRNKMLGRERSEKELEQIAAAKRLLMEQNGMTEAEAHKYLQKCSMDSGNSLMETVGMVMSIMKK